MSLNGDPSLFSTRPVSFASRAEHLEWIDRTKGFGIILVVFGHAVIGLQGAYLMADTPWSQTLIALIYSFHMPLFFLLSGLTFERGVSGKPASRVLKTRIVRLLWPLVLWTYIYALSRILADSGVNTESGWDSLLQWPLPPKDHFWFLWALFLIQMVCLPLVWFRISRSPLIIGALALAAILGFGLLTVPWNDWTVNAAEHLGIFLIGMALARLDFPRLTTGPMLFGMAAIFVGVSAFIVPAAQSPLGVVSVAAILAVTSCFLCAHLTVGRAWLWLGRLGALSMAIYLAHTLFSVTMRIILSRFSEDVALHLVLGTLAGLIGPILLYYTLRRFAQPRVFGF